MLRSHLRELVPRSEPIDVLEGVPLEPAPKRCPRLGPAAPDRLSVSHYEPESAADDACDSGEFGDGVERLAQEIRHGGGSTNRGTSVLPWNVAPLVISCQNERLIAYLAEAVLNGLFTNDKFCL